MKILLEALQNNVDQRNICGGLKVTVVFIGVQGGFTKLYCFLLLCDSRSTAEHYIKRDLEPGETLAPAKNSIQHIPLDNPTKIFLTPLQINLELFKCLVKTVG